MPQVWSTSCRVDIVAPNSQRYTFASTDAQRDLLTVEVHKDMAEACGSFTLQFAPRRDDQGRTWDQIIPMRSLVSIVMERPEADNTPQTSATVMVGLTDDHGSAAEYRRASPRQEVSIRGREMGCVLLDAMLFFHPRLAEDPSAGTLTITSAAFGEQQLALIGNPKLPKAGATPQVILKTILDFYLFVGANTTELPDVPALQQPIINLDLPDIKLADLLQSNTAQWSTFEPVQVPITHTTTQVGSVWNYLHTFIDRYFQEFFTRIDEGVCKIYFRGKPFKHEPVMAGTRFKSSEDEPTLRTINLDPAWILSSNLRRQSSSVYNYFLVTPLGITQYYDDPHFLWQVLPQIVTHVEHPSFVGRYGLRPLIDHSPYLSPLPPQVETAPAPTPLTPPPAQAETYAGMAARIALEEGMPRDQVPWFVGLIHQESGFNPNATSPVLNGKTDKGIAQFSDATATAMGLSNPYDPVASLHAAARYWNQLRVLPYIHNDPRLVAAAYNAGPGAVQSAGGKVPNIATTQRHVRRIEQYQLLYQDIAPAAPTRSPAPMTPAAQGDLQAVVKTAQDWSKILRAWYDMGGELFAGTLEVIGHAMFERGDRLVCQDDRGVWEAYIEGVNHRYDMRSGLFVTTLRLTRGWYLDAAIADQIRQEGKTMVTSATGGPPDIDAEQDPRRVDVTISGSGGTESLVDALKKQGEPLTFTDPAGP